MIEETRNGFYVDIPPKWRKSVVVVLLAMVSFVSVVGYIFILRATSYPLAFVIAICSVLIFAALFGLGGEIFGKETIELDGYLLTVVEIWCGLKITTRFDITMMKGLVVGAASYWQGNTYVASNGRIHFEYKSRTESIGGIVAEDKAFEIVNRIRQQTAPDEVKP